jgi:hypothetical protein
MSTVTTPIRASSVEINTRRHYLSHLREPRGRGGWLFENDAREIVFSHNGTYAEARKAAQVWAAAHGMFGLHVCS